ncbi:MAG: carboxy-S-adenosyl-L-methionine synthase CmoA [Verrucomicrobia bacterium]|nr:carboxy-S-adenosyl-L-methionine synthase CmoA [Verrucomicrobiota bacterium]
MNAPSRADSKKTTEPPVDAIFKEKHGQIDDFDFGQRTAAVFDDMLDRSVPFYAEVQRMLGDLATDFATPGSNLYDLGCSTGTTFLQLDPSVAQDVTFVGIDSSQPMLDKAGEKLRKAGFTRAHELVCADLNSPIIIKNASVVILNLTLQFVRPLRRTALIRSIANGMNEGGCLLLIEKVLSPHTTLNRLFIKHYYEFKKRQGYSELEISQKREALENVLIPYHADENRQMLTHNGFSACDVFFRWYNFFGLVAIK